MKALQSLSPVLTQEAMEDRCTKETFSETSGWHVFSHTGERHMILSGASYFPTYRQDKVYAKPGISCPNKAQARQPRVGPHSKTTNKN